MNTWTSAHEGSMVVRLPELWVHSFLEHIEFHTGKGAEALSPLHPCAPGAGQSKQPLCLYFTHDYLPGSQLGCWVVVYDFVTFYVLCN